MYPVISHNRDRRCIRIVYRFAIMFRQSFIPKDPFSQNDKTDCKLAFASLRRRAAWFDCGRSATLPWWMKPSKTPRNKRGFAEQLTSACRISVFVTDKNVSFRRRCCSFSSAVVFQTENTAKHVPLICRQRFPLPSAESSWLPSFVLPLEGKFAFHP